MSGPCRSLTLASPDATCAFAQALGHRLSAGDVLLLSGGVGAGKTHFARCLIRALLREPEDVPSPTYTLVQTYPGSNCEIWHADLYRLSDPTEVIELGLTEAFESAIALVEWPDRLGDLAPPGALTLDFTPAEAEDTRHLTLTWSDPRWTTTLKGLTDD
ncbi:tRNA threonylcarbamoyladenosine biosynthesis protein TsaE [Roseovarius tolerans]|uniref:tRNA threonylcarbamoyladenosine biosynthesis protein TsaE n=1 Tax=Roseovarius tolerans TaxID=74031 RepID=A0A1H8H3K8_9RHOB|nr:tRNA (adenosine(37)-N6)-threonylcarbamoyltransferase complex ATPase subunit type 1 TsaE [Roseovarius tolerans]SEN50564.1 tRNA threonylcarbamoyladenosine biosynthesis protein TsaE [Roseovarius tolerans]